MIKETDQMDGCVEVSSQAKSFVDLMICSNHNSITGTGLICEIVLIFELMFFCFGFQGLPLSAPSWISAKG